MNMDSKKPLYKSISFWMVVLFLLYSTLGFFAVPYFIKKQLNTFTHDQLNSQLSVESISFNPFKIALEIEDLQIIDKDGVKWFSANKVHGNVNLWSTLTNHPTLSLIAIEGPFFLLEVDQNGETTQLKYPQLPVSEDTTVDAPQAEPLQLSIDDISIDNGSLLYVSDNGKKTIDLPMQDIHFKNNLFSTINGDSEFNLSFITNDQAKTSIAGTFNFSQININSQWEIENWPSVTVFEFISDADGLLYGMQNNGGKINAKGSLNFNQSQQSLPSIVVDEISLSDFLLDSPDEKLPALKWQQLTALNIVVDLNQQSIVINDINLNQSQWKLHFDNEYMPILPNITEDDKVTDAQSIPSKDTQPWQFDIKQITTTGDQITLIKGPQSAINIIDIEKLSINNLTNVNDLDMLVNLLMTVDQQGQVKLDTQINTTTFAVDSSIDATEVNLTSWQAWFPDDIKITLEDGTVSLQQKISLNDQGFTSAGDFQINTLKLLDANQQDFFIVNALNLTNATIDSQQKKVHLDQISFDHAQTIIQVSDKQELNLSNLVDGSKNTEKDTIEDDTQDQDWIIEINQIELQEAQTTLTDKSVNPPYHTELSKLNGTIKGLSSDNLSKADVSLNATLDVYAKIAINGQINPLSEQAYTDLTIDVTDMNLQNFSTYSGMFLGFPIDRGKADFAFNYKLNKSVLLGINDLTFKQLKFGQKNNSKDAINLPLKLAVNLLTDGNGVMKIDLPVRGNIDDPEFSYGGLVFKAFFKLITGIVASPFKLLGKLIPGGAELDLSGIQFEPGSVILKDQEQQKLIAMKQIIEKRPAIVLELSGITNNTSDKKALQELNLLEKLNTQTPVDFTDGTLQGTIKEHFLMQFSEQQWQSIESKATTDENLNLTLLTENAWQILLNAQDVTDQFNQLSKKRAQYIQQQLIDEHGVSIDNIFIKSGLASDDQFPQVQFGIGS